MIYTRFALAISGVVALIGCSHKSSSKSPPVCTTATLRASSSLLTTSTTNIIPIYVADAATTGAYGYTNEPLVSVTVCSPNHTSSSQCQTISNILLDTGSFGLRVFASVLGSQVALTQQTVTVLGKSLPIAQCEVFGSGADWGSVRNGDVILGNQQATNIALQVIDSGFASMPSVCAHLQPDTDPCTAKYNGILGVGLFAQDCGTDCTVTDTSVNPGNYFACSSNGCGNVYSGACAGGTCAVAVPLAQQVINPVAAFASGFNNGISLTLPSVATAGASAVSGTMTLGIGSTAGNTPGAGVIAYDADSSGMNDNLGSDFVTVFTSNSATTYGQSGSSTQAFLDSGSNGIFFPTFGSLVECSDGSGFFCPVTTQSLSATIKGYSGSPSYSASFSIANANLLFNSQNSAFNNLGGSIDSAFDWGLPFFFGRTVFVGLDGTSTTVNGATANGPFWAF